MTESPENMETSLENMPDSPENMETDAIGLTLALNDFASAQGTQISELNNQIESLSESINLVRSYTPEPGSASPSSGEQSAEPRTTAENSAALNADLAAVLKEINSAELNPSSNEADAANLTADPAAQNLNPAGLDTLDQELQAESTQLTTEVQTQTAQASQTVQMSNTMSQAASSVLANMLEEEEEAAGKG
jgi:hypothetical protein